MSQVRIDGQNCYVTKAKVVGDKDFVYTISGEGAAGLHAKLVELETAPSELVDGAFTINSKHLTDLFMDIPFLKTLDRQLATAASGHGKGA